MCFSAQIVASHKKFVSWTGINISLTDFVELYAKRKNGAKIKIPKAMDAGFAEPANDQERLIKTLIDEFNEAEAIKTEQELFKQRKRLADAERTLATKQTKAALESKRIATDKISKARLKLDDLRRVDPKPRDSRIYPGDYGLVMIMEDGKKVVKPMRYQCRPSGMPANFDLKFPGTYNARRDKLEGFWKGLFGYRHGIMIVDAFFENVPLHLVEQRPLAPDEQLQNTVLEFRPRPQRQMLVACLWSHWSSPDEPELLSFAAITDEPPPEVAAAGHDRCIIEIKPEHVDEWLTPDSSNLAAQYRILDDRPEVFYGHAMAA